MSRYRIAAVPSGFVVAREGAAGLLALSEHPTRESAQAEADRMNLVAQALADADARAMARAAEAATLRRSRAVRWIEPDAFA